MQNSLLIGLVIALTIVEVWFLVCFFVKQLHYAKMIMTAFVAFLCVNCVVSVLTSVLPPATDLVKITALEQKNEGAKGCEVYIKGFEVDNKIYKPFPPEEGKWFWIGDQYCWRPSSDKRQPSGTTNSILVKVPIGYERSILFSSSEWRGLAEIVYERETKIVDTSIVPKFDLGKSEQSLLWLQFVLRLSFFVMISFAFYFLAIILLKKILQKTSNMKMWCSKNWDVFVYVVFAGLTLCWMIVYGGEDSFWNDEIYQIGFISHNSSLLDTIHYSATLEESTPFLFGIIANLWYRVVPYGEKWLLLLPRFACSISVIFIGLIGRTIRNKRTGILAAVIASASPVILFEASSEFRSYGFLIFFTSIMVWFYCKRKLTQGKGCYVSLVWYSLAMSVVAYTHYFGIFLCGVIFLFDLILILRKKINKRVLVSYIIAGITYIPWIITVLLFKKNIQATWHKLPQIKDIYSLIKYLCGNEFILFLFIVGISFVTYRLFTKKDEYFLEICLLWGVLSVILGLFIYGHLKSNFTLWAPRYFLELEPLIILLAAIGIDSVCCLLQNKEKKAVLCLVACIWLSYSSGKGMLVSDLAHEPFRQAADWLYSQGGYIYNSDTLVLCTPWPSPVINGWNEYYLTRQGIRDEINVAGQGEISLEDVSRYERIYLFAPHHVKANQQLLELLNKHYQQVDLRPNENITVYEKVKT